MRLWNENAETLTVSPVYSVIRQLEPATQVSAWESSSERPWTISLSCCILAMFLGFWVSALLLVLMAFKHHRDILDPAVSVFALDAACEDVLVWSATEVFIVIIDWASWSTMLSVVTVEILEAGTPLPAPPWAPCCSAERFRPSVTRCLSSADSYC